MNDRNLFELVLHHRYASRDARDLSGHGNHGYGALRCDDGNGGGSVLFDGVRDRIFVPPSKTLSRPGGIRAELVVSLDELGHRRTLIEGYLSFAVYVEPDGSLGASVYRYLNWYGVRSPPGLVPLGTWVTITFTYTDDGILALLLNGDLVAEAYRMLGPANGIDWPFGLSIGAWPDADRRLLKGRVTEVKLWRAASGG